MKLQTKTCLPVRRILLLGLILALAVVPRLRADHIPITGLSTNHEGVVNWNVTGLTGAVEPPRGGHELTWLRGLPPYSKYYAYHYVASRDYDGIDPDATSAFRAGAPVAGFTNLLAALAANGFTIAQLSARFGLMTLGADDAQVWNYDAASAVETRRYRGGSVRLQLDGQDLVAGPMPDFIFTIRYNVLTNLADDQISGVTSALMPTNNSAGSSAAVQAVASALLTDIGPGALRLVMDSLQPEIQVELNQPDKSRLGGFLDAQSGRIELVRPPRLSKGSRDGADRFRSTASDAADAAAYVVEASTDLRNWSPVATNFPTAGGFEFIDPGSATDPRRFFRALFR